MNYWIGLIALIITSTLVFRHILHREYQMNAKLTPLSVILETLIFAAHANLPYLYLSVPWPEFPPLPDHQFISSIWLGIMVLGGILTLGIMVYLGFKPSLGQGSENLRQTGPYRWSRNPQILTYSLVVIGFVALFPSLESGAWALLYAFIAHIMILTEEEYLRSMFGDVYLDYCKRVPRYFRIKRLKGILSSTSEE